MAITASMVKELRESTGAGMMDAKKALTETSGDFEASKSPDVSVKAFLASIIPAPVDSLSSFTIDAVIAIYPTFYISTFANGASNNRRNYFSTL